MKKLIYCLTFVAILFSMIGVYTVHAQDIIFQDDFSSTLEKWRPLRDDGRYWRIDNQALEATVPFGSTITELVPIINPNEYIKNYAFDLDFTALQGADRNISFGVIDAKNWYELHFAPHGSSVVRVKNGAVVWLKNFPFVLQNGTTQKVSVIFLNGRVILLIDGEQILDTTDPTFENNFGSIAVKATTGGVFPTKVRFDNILVREILDAPQVDGTSLGVELLKQDNSEWAGTEYDTASVWAPVLGAGATFKDWGCNLLSMVMLMKYHGIDTLSDGSPLTPQSLNRWLLNNNGFYSNPPSGNINRKSISQLTAEISAIQNTPKLEFLYVGENLLETAIAEIEKGNPVILELEGHFVIADGFTSDKSDLYIKDPAYNVDKLSEHPLPLRSVRLYTPSQTDLSYISVVTGEGVETEVSGSTQVVAYSERLKQFSSQPSSVFTPESKIIDIPKPSSAQYTITFDNVLQNTQPVTVQTFTTLGKSQEFTFSLITGKHTYELNYAKDGTSKLQPKKVTPFTYKDFRKTINQLSDARLIKQKYFEKVLVQLIKPAEQLSAKNQKKLLQVVKTIIATAPKSLLTKPAQSLLLDQVKLLMASIK